MAAKKSINKNRKPSKTPEIPQSDTYTHDHEAVQRPEVSVQATIRA
jgi:hypothetical protein